MRGRVEDVEHALLLRSYGVPYSVLTHIFGHDDMYWYRLETSLGLNSIVGTTVKKEDKLPTDLLADEKHTTMNGEKTYLATTVAQGCVFGAAVCTGASTEDLIEGYGVYAQEAQNVSPEYQANSYNTDGYVPTGNALKTIFETVVIIPCFVHAYLNIKERCRKWGSQFYDLSKQIWDVYQAPTKASFAQRVRRLGEWAQQNVSSEIVLEKILALCKKSSAFQKAYDHPGAYRTSNMIDRIMKDQDRYLFNTLYFHSHFYASELRTRSWALLHNFTPYCKRVSKKDTQLDCPATRLNGFYYRDNWLENLMVSASMGGYRQ